MEVNRDFFNENCKELIINSYGSINLFFGSKGCRYHKLNDVTIIPKSNSIVKITVKIKGL